MRQVNLPSLAIDANLLAFLERVVTSGITEAQTAKLWYAEVEAFLKRVMSAEPQEWRHRAFLNELWDSNPVCATGSGSVKMQAALEDRAFCAWFADRVQGFDCAMEEEYLISFYDEAAVRLQKLCGRTPHLKLNRVLCTVRPTLFTSLADLRSLRRVHFELGGRFEDHPIRAHIRIRACLNRVLGQVPEDDVSALVRRICLPWFMVPHLPPPIRR